MLKAQFEALQAQNEDLYHFLNHFRHWVNEHLVNYEIFLEDNWFEDKTTIEYTLRCLDTFNIVVFAEDTYKNYRKEGTWHLGDYVKTDWTVGAPWQILETFIQENTPPRYQQATHASNGE